MHHGKAGGVFDPAGPGSRIASTVEPREGETILLKGLPNSFAGTRLEELLKPTGRRELILAGLMTYMCISATARSALDHGYRGTVVASACATRDLPDPLGGVLPAAQVHRAALAELADRFAVVCRDARACG